MLNQNNSDYVYIVVAYGGRYDGSWSSNIIATLDRSLAEDYISKAPVRQAHWNEFGEKVRKTMEEWDNSYREENPCPFWDGEHSNALIED